MRKVSLPGQGRRRGCAGMGCPQGWIVRIGQGVLMQKNKSRARSVTSRSSPPRSSVALMEHSAAPNPIRTPAAPRDTRVLVRKPSSGRTSRKLDHVAAPDCSFEAAMSNIIQTRPHNRLRLRNTERFPVISPRLKSARGRSPMLSVRVCPVCVMRRRTEPRNAGL